MTNTTMHYNIAIPQIAVRFICSKTFFIKLQTANVVDQNGVMYIDAKLAKELAWADREDTFYALVEVFEDAGFGRALDQSFDDIKCYDVETSVVRNF